MCPRSIGGAPADRRNVTIDIPLRAAAADQSRLPASSFWGLESLVHVHYSWICRGGRFCGSRQTVRCIFGGFSCPSARVCEVTTSVLLAASLPASVFRAYLSRCPGPQAAKAGADAAGLPGVWGPEAPARHHHHRTDALLQGFARCLLRNSACLVWHVPSPQPYPFLWECS